MDTGNFLHIIVTVIAILGAAAVALVCDMLKTNNERLREANLELSVRREEEQRRADFAVDQLRRLTPAFAERPLALAEPGASTALALPARTGISISQAMIQREPPEQLSSALEQAIHPPQSYPAHPEATLDEARRLAKDFLAALASKERQDRSPGSRRSEGRGETRNVQPVPASVPETAVARVSRRNWEQLLKSGTPRPTIDVTPSPAGSRRGELIPFESLQNSQAHHEFIHRLPSGFHETGDWADLLETDRPLHGLVVSVALNAASDSEGSEPEERSRELLDEASDWVKGTLASDEFGCQSPAGQFLIVSPQPQDQSQQRLVEITERLWDFQLRPDVAAALILSWGSYESSGERLSDAIACAVQRMEENRSRRTAAPAEGRQRRAV